MNNNKPSFFENLASNAAPPPSSSVIPPINSSSGGKGKKLLFGVFGVLLLLSSVGVGAFLVQQNQNINERAAGTNWEYSADGKCIVVTSGTVEIQRFNGASCPTVENSQGTQVVGPGTYCPSPSNSSDNNCQQVDVVGSGQGVCSCGPESTPKPPVCGEQCTSDSQCEASNPNSMCSGGICVNKSCPGKTTPGANCECSAQNACGQPCGIQVGLCQAGSTCGFINVPTNQCAAYETKSDGQQSPNQFCIPDQPANGYTLAPRCEDLRTLRLAKSDGSVTGLTQQDIISACNPAPTTNPISARCVRILVYDTNWERIGDARLPQLEAGQVIRLTVLGTTTGGTIDQARFRINGQLQNPVTTKKPGTEEFYTEYTIPADIKEFRFNAQLHHSSIGWY